MKRCLACDAHYHSTATACPVCGNDQIEVDGFPAYAPDFAHEGGGFKADYFSELARLEGNNFWFRARNQLIIWAIQTYCGGVTSFLEVGCGTGYVLSGIAQTFPQARLMGSEIFTSGLNFAAERLPHVNFVQMDARNIPFFEEFDVIGAFDVVEHIEEDELVLAQLRDALTPHGHVVLTVPQHAWLWSAVDEYACHVRRYTAEDLHLKLEKAGFSIVRTTSFVTMLLPLMLFSRLFQRNIKSTSFDPTAELRIAPWLNAILFRLLGSELALIRKGVTLPFGGSRLIVARKV
jgi:SAM-dependent methyltransferase